MQAKELVRAARPKLYSKKKSISASSSHSHCTMSASGGSRAGSGLSEPDTTVKSSVAVDIRNIVVRQEEEEAEMGQRGCDGQAEAPQQTGSGVASDPLIQELDCVSNGARESEGERADRDGESSEDSDVPPLI